MRSSFFSSLAQCEFGDWVGIGVLIAVGAFSLTFLGLGSMMLARYLLDSARHKNTGTT